MKLPGSFVPLHAKLREKFWSRCLLCQAHVCGSSIGMLLNFHWLLACPLRKWRTASCRSLPSLPVGLLAHTSVCLLTGWPELTFGRAGWWAGYTSASLSSFSSLGMKTVRIFSDRIRDRIRLKGFRSVRI